MDRIGEGPGRVPLHDLVEMPTLRDPVLIVSLKGWVDAGLAGDGAIEVMANDLGRRTIARFDPDRLLDWRARRPTMHVTDGVLNRVSWDTTELSWTTDGAGNQVVLLCGDEPDNLWLQFTDEIMGLIERLGVRMVIGLGAFPAPTPHTRDPLLSCTASSEELAGLGFLRATLEVPSGIQGLIERKAAKAGLPGIGLWVQVPHYVSAMPYPAASLALIRGANRVGGLALPEGDLEARAQRTRDRIDLLVSQNPEHLAMLHQLEVQADQATTAVQMGTTTGDDLAAELERFLRDHDT